MTLAITTIVLGTSNSDKYLPNPDDNLGQNYQGNSASGGFWYEYHDTVFNLTLVNIFDASHIASFPGSTFPGDGRAVPRGLDPDGSCYGRASSDGRIVKCHTDGTSEYFTPTHDDATAGVAVDSNGDLWGINGTSAKPVKLSSINYSAHTCTETDAGVAANYFIKFLRNAGGITGRIYGMGSSGQIRWIDTSTGVGTEIITGARTFCAVVGADGNIYSTSLSGSTTTLHQHDQDGTLLNSLAFSGSIEHVVTLDDEQGFVWAGGTTSGLDFLKIDQSTLTVADTVPNPGPTIWLEALGIFAPGVPLLSSQQNFGGLASIFPVVELPITGNDATGSVGTMAPSRSLALSGNSGTGSPGSLIAVSALALAGLAATGSVGTLGVGNTEAMLGNVATGAPGTLGVQVNTNVTVALTGVAGTGGVGTLTALGGSWPAPPFAVQILMDGPRNTTLKVAAAISVDFPQSLLADPMALSSIEPGFPSGPFAARLALERVAFNITDGLQILQWWAAPTPTLMLTLEGHGELVFRKRGFLQNPDPAQPGQILISSRGLSGTQTFTLTARLIKQGSSA